MRRGAREEMLKWDGEGMKEYKPETKAERRIKGKGEKDRYCFGRFL